MMTKENLQIFRFDQPVFLIENISQSIKQKKKEKLSKKKRFVFTTPFHSMLKFCIVIYTVH